MSEVTTIGLDLAKNVFQVHGIDALGQVAVRRQLRRSQLLPFFEKQAACVVGIEACATSHHWAREIAKLGHEVRLMPARYVKPYVKRNKNDAADAEAICEAVTGIGTGVFCEDPHVLDIQLPSKRCCIQHALYPWLSSQTLSL